MPSKSEKQRRFMAAELRRKRQGEETETDMTEEQLEDFASNVKNESPPPGTQGFTQIPTPSDAGPVELPDGFSQTPDRSDPETADPSSPRKRGSTTKGRPNSVQDFGSGAEQRGTTPQTKRVESDALASASGGANANPDGVTSHDQGADV